MSSTSTGCNARGMASRAPSRRFGRRGDRWRASPLGAVCGLSPPADVGALLGGLSFERVRWSRTPMHTPSWHKESHATHAQLPSFSRCTQSRRRRVSTGT